MLLLLLLPLILLPSDPLAFPHRLMLGAARRKTRATGMIAVGDVVRFVDDVVGLTWRHIDLLLQIA